MPPPPPPPRGFTDAGYTGAATGADCVYCATTSLAFSCPPAPLVGPGRCCSPRHFMRFEPSFLEYMPSCDVEGMALPAACAGARALRHRALHAQAAVAVARSIIIPRRRVVGKTTRPTLNVLPHSASLSYHTW